MATSISDYVCNLIAGRTPISNLYYAVDRARIQRSRGALFCYKVTFNGVGSKTYKSNELLALDDRACRCTLSRLLSEINGTPTLDQYVGLLLHSRNEILNLYQARYRALFLRSTARVFAYTFNNPFGTAAGVSRNKLGYCNANKFLRDFCNCERNVFSAQLVLGGLYN